ncbi:hypothetical protein N7G274_007060 [Stereocaulon virgatum]|uniref:WD repeat-containing protein JIP5 n=1 Tax=Stereocaulon virgatum TaxID=373712 RepID=A0ABR4A6Y2_9LECA
MFDTICTYPLTTDLFAQCIHPSSPLLALGLASGHVQLQRLPPAEPSRAPEAGHSTIETAWRTRRHKGSCRSLCFSHDGEILFSAGTDGLVKAAKTETGQVESKIGVPLHNSGIDPTSIIHALSPQTLLLATDSSALHLYDLRTNPKTTKSHIASQPSQTYHPHDDYISSLTPLPPTDASTSGFAKQWISTGGTTVAVADLRRGVLVKSEDQGEELLSSIAVKGKLVVGGENGVLRMWEIGVWDDSEETLTVGKGASADVLAAGPDGLVGVGMDDGSVRFVGMGVAVGKKKGRASVIGEVRHDEVEGVLGLGWEVGGRLISGGGSVVKVWEESSGGGEASEDDEGEVGSGEKPNGCGSGDDGEGGKNEDESSEEEEKPRRKKRKKNKGKGKDSVRHVLAFKGMD